MKRLSLLMLLAATTYALTGCMVTDYPCIHDTENDNYAECSDYESAYPLTLHDTKGWAHIVESTQTATDNNGDGIYTYFAPFVQQDSNGDGMIAAVAQSSTLPFYWHSDLYAQGGQKDLVPFAYGIYDNEDDLWNGDTQGQICPTGVWGDAGTITGNCLQSTAIDEFPFDYALTTNCLAGCDDLSILTSYFTRTGEAGRSAWGFDQSARLELLALGTPTADGMEFVFNAADWTAVVEQGQYSQQLDLSAFDGLRVTLGQGIVGNQVLAQAGSDAVLGLGEQMAALHRDQPITLSVSGYGHTFEHTFGMAKSFNFELLAGALDPTGQSTGGRR